MLLRLNTILTLTAIITAGCSVEVADVSGPEKLEVARTYERPTVNLPTALRKANWIGRRGSGSCVHATLINLLRWQGRPATADWWQATYDSGETASRASARLTAAGIRFAATDGQRDTGFLDWACRTRRGCGVTVLGGRHMVALVHLDARHAGILDPNRIDRVVYVDRDAFLAEWFASHSWAITPVYTPAPPLP